MGRRASAMSDALEEEAPQRTREREGARQKRKLHAALRLPPQQDAVDVNDADDAALLQALAQIRKLPSSVAKRIVALRPFNSRTELISRVNASSVSKKDRIGPKFIPMLRVDGACSLSLSCMPDPSIRDRDTSHASRRRY